MGRTPGKWFKALLSGKKSSKSHSSKKQGSFNLSSNKDVLVSSEAHVSDPIADSSLISQPTSGANATIGSHSEKGLVSQSSDDKIILLARDEDTNSQAVVDLGLQDALEKTRSEQAAIKAQAAFRGYQARREFRTLKSIIQLQAFIRGHLVRRQAISTLYCVKGIVKFQALARGYKVRRSDIGLAVHEIRKDTKCSDAVRVSTPPKVGKLSESVFINKLLASSSSVFPLYLNYDPTEPNLASEWLDRWTRSRHWADLPESRTKLDLVSNEKNASSQTVNSNEGQVKRKVRKASGLKVDDGSISDSNKSKQRPKKVSTHPSHSSQEIPRKEVAKSNFKKPLVHNVSDRSETSNEKRKHLVRKLSGNTVSDVSEHGLTVSAQKANDLSVSKSKQSDLEQSLELKAEDEHDNPIADVQTSMNNGRDEGIQGVNENLDRGNNGISSVSPKNCQRRASLPANFDKQDDAVQNTPRLPSYMAPTESAKARLRGQGSPGLASGLVDKNGVTRRHSLTSSASGKLGSFSPRTDRLVAMGNKGMIRTDKSLSSSRDETDKWTQPQWRR